MLTKATKRNIFLTLKLCVVFVFTIALTIAVFPAKQSRAGQITKLINFQGKLTKSDGTNVADGNYSMQFKMYDALSAGNLLWTETWDGVSNGSTQVTVTNGVFSVQLGTYVSLASVDFTTKSVYLSVNFNPGGGYDGEMSPRKQLVASAFSFNANNVVGDGRIDVAYAPADTNNPGARINYSPSVASANAALSVTAGANVSGAAFNVIQSGTGGAILIGATALGGLTQTYLGANPASFSGNFVDFQVGSSSKFKVDNGGTVTIAGTVTSGTHTLSANSSLVFSSGTGSIQFTGNAGTGGTTAGLIVKIDSSGNVVTTGTGDTNLAIGVATNTAALNSPVQVAIHGVVSAVADNAVTAGDFIGVGTTTAGRAKDLGATYPTTSSVQVIGRALASATAGSNFNLLLEGLDNNVSAGGACGACVVNNPSTSQTITPSATGVTGLIVAAASSGSADIFDVTNNGGTTKYIQVASTGNVTHNAPTTVLTPTNSSTAFSVQNSQGAPVFLVDTTTPNNLVTNFGFEVNTNGWAPDTTGGSVSITRVTTNQYHGQASLQIQTSTNVANVGAKVSTFNSAITSSTQYTFSFYALASGSSFNTLVVGHSNDGTARAQDCALSTTVLTTGWQRLTCTLTFGTVSGSPYIYINWTDSATRTMFIDAVQLQTGAIATPYQDGNVQIRGIVNNPVTLSALSNSTSAFQIQDSAGTANLFVADTLNKRIGIGTSSPANQVQVNATAAPTVDMVNITNANFPANTAQVNALSIFYTASGSTVTTETSAVRLDLTPGSTSGSTWDGIRSVVNAAGPATGVTENDLKLDGPTTGGAGTYNGINISGILPAAGGTATGETLAIPAFTSTTAATTAINGWNLASAGLLTQSTAAGTINWNGASIQMPAVTQSTGTINANGLQVLANGAITTGGTVTGIRVTTGSIAAGTFAGIKVGATAASQTITAGSAVDGLIVDLNTNYSAATGANVDVAMFASPTDSNINTGLKRGLVITGGAVTQNTAATGTYSGIDFTMPTLSDTIASGVLNANGLNLTTATQTQTVAATTTYTGFNLGTAGALTQNTAAGTINWRGLFVQMPNITQTTGTITASGSILKTGTVTTQGTENGLSIDMSATTITTAGTAQGLNITPWATESAAGTFTAININGITTQAAATSSAFKVGNNWDTDVSLSWPSATTAITNTTLDIGAATAVQQLSGTIKFARTSSGSASCASATAQGIVFKDETNTQRAHFCVDSAGQMKIFASGVTAGTDVAENYSDLSNTLTPGDVVVFDPVASKSAKTTTTPYDPMLFGIVSTDPGYLMSGIKEDGETDGVVNPKPIALNGRVPVHVSTENGPIHVGDFLTTSSVPGVAMRATKAGPVISQAMQDYNSTGVGMILSFVTHGYYNGQSLEQLASSATTSDLAASDPNQRLDKRLLAYFANNAAAATTQTATSQVTATQAGTGGSNPTAAPAPTSELYLDRIAAGLEIISPKIATNGLVVDQIGSLHDAVHFVNDVSFIGRPYFNSDTAGFAVIKKNQTSVDVTFSAEYLDQPVVSVTMTAEQDLRQDPSFAQDQIRNIFSNNLQYAVMNKSTKGFTIVLSKQAPVDMKFSWVALAVTNAKTFMSDPSAVDNFSVDNSVTSLPTPEPVAPVQQDRAPAAAVERRAPPSAQAPASTPAAAQPLSVTQTTTSTSSDQSSISPDQNSTPTAVPAADPAPATTPPQAPVPAPAPAAATDQAQTAAQ